MAVKHAQGCLLGRLAGDPLGSMVVSRSPEEIRRNFPNGLLEPADGGTGTTIADQPTDDSETALLPARSASGRSMCWKRLKNCLAIF